MDYRLDFDSPSSQIEQFFASTFSPTLLESERGHELREWKREAMQIFSVSLFLPFQMYFHSKEIAAGILLAAKVHLRSKGINLPGEVGSHPWYMYVDPELSKERIGLFQRIFEEELTVIRALNSRNDKQK